MQCSLDNIYNLKEIKKVSHWALCFLGSNWAEQGKWMLFAASLGPAFSQDFNCS
jgi:hypothetical protein